jgi:preprotein translocase subunit SecG
MLYYLFVTLYVVACLVLMIVILLQQGKGGDIANAFGGGASQAVFGARAGATVLTKVTTGLSAAFMVIALLLAVWGSRGTSSVVGGVEGPAAPQLPAAATAPMTAPPAGATPSTPAPAATTTPESAAPAAAPATPTPAPTEPPPAKKQ